jgi:hypothetical protein
MQCDDCRQDPCRCQRTLAVVARKQEVPQRYQFAQCTMPGCTALIGFLTGAAQGDLVCKWCRTGRSHKR